MFNHIRKVPYVAGDGKGGVSYFSGSFQSQYGLETQVIAAICESPARLKTSRVPLLTLCQMVLWHFAPLHWPCEYLVSQTPDPSRLLRLPGAESSLSFTASC